ncbi:hypothetical protein AWM75_02720 [Aerococcus urinaehominis]|uniref:16S rRNA (cytosine(967)-C(5))-methyltransferase n=1 Tax=Aerococcus urinaehominis TaxID=128944 RepID=A0A0X8FKH5_9LACT|nr:16S rRNA (cytosine(967)-C(5))-methyltransferase RsmB [Aerococcus urinaehominis]AMB98975.1 hypothetical protein AWM75_02720 [Aerococcus urinaehominis]SDM37524.1 16S rRNA (cytosine967-C5)-methyltransferase [Aerococcus urinaehominis]
MTQSIRESARYLAMVDLVAINQGAFSDQVVNQRLKGHHFSDPDRRLYTRLVYGTTQYRLPLTAIFKDLVAKPKGVKSWLKQLILMSLYQFYYMDQVPDHAVVDEAVKITKKRGNYQLSRFTNGVLRNARRQYPDLASFLASQAQDWLTQSQLKYSIPATWVTYFERRFGRDQAELVMASFNQDSHLTIRVNQHDWPQETSIIKDLTDQGLELEASPLTAHCYRIGRGNVSQTPAFLAGQITIQDESAALAVEVMAPQAGERVLDLCAAPGGKTVQMAERVGSDGQVMAQDIASDKLALIVENLKRMGVADQVALSQGDARQASHKYPAESFDRILVDAPCSGIGLFRRKPDTKYRKELADLSSLQDIQLEILQEAVKLLKKDGILTYSTCTITAEENQQVVERILDQVDQLQPQPLPGELMNDQVKRALTSSSSLEILPHYVSSDGFFIANFIKK